MKIKCLQRLRSAAIIVLLCCKTMQSRLREQHLPSMLAHCTQKNQEPVQNNDGSGEIGLSVSTLHWGRHASLSWLWRRNQRFCISKVKEKDFFLNCVLHCNCKCVQQGCKRDCNLWIRKQYRLIAFKTMYVQFCNEAKSYAYWLVNETLWYETETLDFQSETRLRQRPSEVSTRPRRDGWKLRLETETSRPRLNPWILLLNIFFLQIVDTCLSCEDNDISCAMVPRRRFFASCISSEPRAARFRPAS